MIKKSNGLTLIEVLVASLLLFMSLAVISAAYQQNLQLQFKAKKYLSTSIDFESIVAEVDYSLSTGVRQGRTSQPDVSWQATELKRAPQIATQDEESGAFVGGVGNFILYEISVVNEKGVNLFQYRKAIWRSSAD